MNPYVRLLVLTLGTIGFLIAGSISLRSCGQARIYEPSLHPLLQHGFALIAIRGGSQEQPENTFAAFDHAQKQGAWIHFDLRVTKDHQLIVFKDERLERTTNGKGFVRDHTLSEIQVLQAGKGFEGSQGQQVPSMEQTLMRYPSTTLIIEVQDNVTGIAERVLERLNPEQRNRVVLTSPHTPVLNEFRKVGPSIATASQADEVQRLVILSSLSLESAAPIKGEFLISPFSKNNIVLLNDSTVTEIHRRFKKVFVWNVNDEASGRKALELQVDGIATERPALLRGTIGARIGQ